MPFYLLIIQIITSLDSWVNWHIARVVCRHSLSDTSFHWCFFSQLNTKNSMRLPAWESQKKTFNDWFCKCIWGQWQLAPTWKSIGSREDIPSSNFHCLGKGGQYPTMMNDSEKDNALSGRGVNYGIAPTGGFKVVLKQTNWKCLLTIASDDLLIIHQVSLSSLAALSCHHSNKAPF